MNSILAIVFAILFLGITVSLLSVVPTFAAIYAVFAGFAAFKVVHPTAA